MGGENSWLKIREEEKISCKRELQHMETKSKLDMQE